MSVAIVFSFFLSFERERSQNHERSFEFQRVENEHHIKQDFLNGCFAVTFNLDVETNPINL